jgi:hypothetical protein
MGYCNFVANLYCRKGRSSSFPGCRFLDHAVQLHCSFAFGSWTLLLQKISLSCPIRDAPRIDNYCNAGRLLVHILLLVRRLISGFPYDRVSQIGLYSEILI